MLTPLNDRVVVRPDKPEETTASGIILVQKEERAETGVVVVGNALVFPGQHVVFSRYAYDEVKDGDEKLLLVSTSGLLAIID